MSQQLMQMVVVGIQQIQASLTARFQKYAGARFRCLKLGHRLDDLKQDLEYLKQHDNEDVRRCFRQLHQFTEEVAAYIKRLDADSIGRKGPLQVANSIAQANKVDDELTDLEEELNYLMMRVTMLISRNTNQMVNRRKGNRPRTECDSGGEPMSMMSMATTESHISDEDKVRLLEMQVKVCMEDFQQERSDREKAQGTIVTLQQELQQLHRQRELDARRPQQSASKGQHEGLNTALMTAQLRTQQMEQEKQRLETENRQLRLQCDRLQNSSLLSSAGGRQAEPMQGSSEGQEDRVMMLETLINIRTAEHEQDKAILEAQVRTCMDDFDAERREKVRAEQRVRDLEEELDLVRRQLEQFQASHMDDLAERRMTALAMHQNQYNQAHSHMNRFAVMADGDIEEDGGQDDVGGDCIDSLGNGLDGGPSFRLVTDSAKKSSMKDDAGNDEMLYCPKCSLPYPTSRHSDLVDHVLDCCK